MLIINTLIMFLCSKLTLRNPKDACVSFFHMDKLMSHHGMREDYDFEDYATKIYMKGKVVYGSYWEHVNVSMKLMNMVHTYFIQRYFKCNIF